MCFIVGVGLLSVVFGGVIYVFDCIMGWFLVDGVYCFLCVGCFGYFEFEC